MAYIRTIWNEGSRYGICKIIPPAGWTGSNTSVVAEDVKFSTKWQDIHMLRHRHRGVNEAFLSYTTQYHLAAKEAAGHELPSLSFPPALPMLASVTKDAKQYKLGSNAVDLYQLYFAVHRRGGYDECHRNEGWEGVANDLGLSGDYAFVLDDIYVLYLFPLPSAYVVLKTFPPPPGWCRSWDGERQEDEGRGDDRQRAVAVEKEATSSEFDSVLGSVCVVSCHGCHLSFSHVSEEGVANASLEDGKVLTCIGCGRSWHKQCYDGEGNTLRRNFVCEFEDCSFGFQQQGAFTLSHYRSESNKFKSSWFKGKHSDGTQPSWQEVESEYWKVVENPTRSVIVKYGNDLDTKRVGSGFPSESNGWVHDKARTGLNPHDAPDPWNLNVLPSVCGSLLKYSSHSIKGINVPWLYCGSMFSTFCYHAEDLNMMSINYMHESEKGGGKIWYGAPPGPGALAFEAAMRTSVPELFQTQPHLQFELVTMVSPVELRMRGASVCRAVQRPGEFILTFPQAYHGGFSLGYNVAEAVNFFTPECFPWMRAAVRQSRARGVEPVFDMPLFVLDLGTRLGVHADLTANDVDIIAEELEYVASLEKKYRLQVLERLFGRFDEPSEVSTPGKSCSFCGQACHLSILRSATDSKFYCLACVADRITEFQKSSIVRLGDSPKGSCTKPHSVQFFVQGAQFSDLIRRARMESSKARLRDIGMD